MWPLTALTNALRTFFRLMLTLPPARGCSHTSLETRHRLGKARRKGHVRLKSPRSGKGSGSRPPPPTFHVLDSLKVRSKSEAIIALQLYYNGFTFWYETEIVVEGKRLIPDFVVELSSGKRCIWEHFGLLGDTQYKKRADEKRALYKRLRGWDFVETQEGDDLGLQIEEILKNWGAQQSPKRQLR